MNNHAQVINAAKKAGFYVEDEDADYTIWDNNDYVEQDGCGMEDIRQKLIDFFNIAYQAGIASCCGKIERLEADRDDMELALAKIGYELRSIESARILARKAIAKGEK